MTIRNNIQARAVPPMLLLWWMANSILFFTAAILHLRLGISLYLIIPLGILLGLPLSLVLQRVFYFVYWALFTPAVLTVPVPSFPQHEIFSLPALEIARKIRLKELRCVEVIDLFVERLQLCDSYINAIVFERFAEARQEALAVDAKIATWDGKEALPIYLGCPLTVKDHYAVKGCPETIGSLPRKNRLSSHTSTCVAELQSAGFIIMGITNVPEFLGGEANNFLHGATLNPYCLTRTPIGSSGGEAAIIASSASVVGLGSDLGGSIRSPAAWCGVYGHKSSGGAVRTDDLRVTIPPSNPLCLSGCMGPMSRYAVDLWPLLRLMAGGRRLGEEKGIDWLTPQQQANNPRIRTVTPADDKQGMQALPIFSSAPLNPLTLDLSTLTVYHVHNFPSLPISEPSLELAHMQVLDWLESKGAQVYRNVALPGLDEAPGHFLIALGTGLSDPTVFMGSKSILNIILHFIRALFYLSPYTFSGMLNMMICLVVNTFYSADKINKTWDRVAQLRELTDDILTGKISIADAWKQEGTDPHAIYKAMIDQRNKKRSPPLPPLSIPTVKPTGPGPIVLVLPAWCGYGTPHYHLGDFNSISIQNWWNVMWMPATVVPLGMSTPEEARYPWILPSQSRPMPKHIQLVGARGKDYVTIGVAVQLEKAGISRWTVPTI